MYELVGFLLFTEYPLFLPDRER